MDRVAVIFWGIDALIAGFILWRLYYIYKDSRTCIYRDTTPPEDTPGIEQILDMINDPNANNNNNNNNNNNSTRPSSPLLPTIVFF